MASKIQLRRGTSAQWSAANPVLADGEQGLDKDSGRIKVGDGVSDWASLPYLTSDAAPGGAGTVTSVTGEGVVTVSGDPTTPVISITEDETHRFTTDAEKAAWNGKQAQATTLAGYGITDAAPKSHSDSTSNPHDTTAAQVGADATGTASGLMTTHTAAADPHPGYALESTIGQVGGIAPLDGTGKVASVYLPSFVDDVLEVASYAALPGTGESGKIYTTLDDGKIYRWGGSAYVTIAASPGSTDDVTEGSGNLYFTAARVLGTVLAGLSTASGTVVNATHTVLQAIGFLQKQTSDNATAISGKAASGAITASGLTQATAKLLGRGTAGTGAVEEITLGTGLSLTGTTLNAASGGLTNFAESVSTASPNATVPVVRLLATNAATDVDIALSPKGYGSLAAQVANNAATGGNKRGFTAVDWQLSRSAASQVASGFGAVICGGENSTASGQKAFVGAGTGNMASGGYSFVGGGFGNTASGGQSTVAGGVGNVADSTRSVAAGAYATTRLIDMANAWGNSAAGLGSHQTCQYLLRKDATTATPAVLTADANAATSTNTVCLPSNASYYLRLRVIARNTTTGVSKAWKAEVLITRGATAASTAIVGTPTITSDFGDVSLAAATVALTANTTIGGLGVTVTGIAATNLRWLAHVEALETTN